MDDIDDFGDLYGDLDCRMSVDKDGEEVKPKSIEDELLVGESGSSEKAAASEAKGEESSEEDDGNNSDSEEDGNNSDSEEDDFRIVLNEGECHKFQPLGGGIPGIDEEDEGENAADHSDQLPAAAAGNESVQGREARGIGLSGYHHPVRHMGSHFAGFTSGKRASLSWRSAWDNPLMPCFQGAAFYTRDISGAPRTGATFRLPQSRTIFDVNIEAFEWKPWRHHGADLTDYFNFGLDEESWKSYCEALDMLRKQAMMPNRFQVYQSSMSQGERHPSLLESLENESTEFDIPKGKAIQVEGGIGERVPSTDIRRPRVQDSDVVIQINMEGFMEDASGFCEDDLELPDEHANASISTSGNESNERDWSPYHDGRIHRHITNSVEDNSPELTENNFRETSNKVNRSVGCGKNDDEEPCRADASRLEEDSDSGRAAGHRSISYNIESHSDESKDACSVGDGSNPVKKTSVEELQDPLESDNCLSYDSISDASDYATESELEHRRDVAHEHVHSTEDDKHLGETRLKSVAEVSVDKDNEQASCLVRRDDYNDLDQWETKSKTRKRKSGYDADVVRGHLCSYRETEFSRTYKSIRHAAEHDSKRSTEDYHPRDHVTYAKRSSNDEDCSRKRGSYFSERRHEGRVRRSSVHTNSNLTTSGNKYFFKERDSYMHLDRERDDRHRIRVDPKYDDIVRDHRYRKQYMQDVDERRIGFYYEEDRLSFKSHGRISFAGRKIRSFERSRYDRGSSSDRNHSRKYFENEADYWLDRHRHKETLYTDERGWDGACSPRKHLSGSWGSKARCTDHNGHLDSNDLQFKSKKYVHVASMKDHCDLMYEDSLESDINGYISEGNVYLEDVSSIKLRRPNQVSKLNLHADDDGRFRHCEQGNVPVDRFLLRRSPSGTWYRQCERNSLLLDRFLLDGSSEEEDFQVRESFLYGEGMAGRRTLNNARKFRLVGTSSIATDHVNFVPDVGRSELAAIGCRNTINKDLNGLKGKLAGRNNGVVIESGKEIGTSYKGNKVKDSRVLQEGYKEVEINSQTVKGEGSHSRRTRLKVNQVEDSKTVSSKDHTISPDKPVAQNLGETEIEEGELIEESDKQDVVPVKKGWNSGRKPEKFQPKDSSDSGKVSGVYDNARLLETLAKMEKRKERFKESISSKQEPETPPTVSQVDVPVISDEVKQQRPARKRRWVGN